MSDYIYHRNSRGGLSVKLLIIIGCAVLLSAGGGFFAYIKFVLPSKNAPAQPQAASVPNPKKSADLPGPIFDLDTFIVNLMGDSGRRYLKITIKMELSVEELKAEITQKMPEIRDNILVLLSSKSYDDVADVSGKIRLRAEIINRVNNTLTMGEIRKIYFTEFVIQ